MKPRIRKGTPQELKRLFGTFVKHFDKRIRDYTRDRIKEGDVTFVAFAEVDGTIVGFTAMFLDENGKEAGVTVVISGYRCMGVGTALLKYRYSLFPDVISKAYIGNIASTTMCKKAGLTVVDRSIFLDLEILHFGVPQ